MILLLEVGQFDPVAKCGVHLLSPQLGLIVTNPTLSKKTVRRKHELHPKEAKQEKGEPLQGRSVVGGYLP